MSRRRPYQKTPIWAYVVLNIFFLLVMFGMYHVSVWYSIIEKKYFSVGIFPILLTCYIAFTIVCIYDAVYDRLSSREPEKKAPKEEKPQPSTSREASKKID